MSSLRAVARLLPLVLLAGCPLGDDQGDDDGPSAMGEDGTAGGDTGSGMCFEPPQCNPLSPECADGELCVSSGSAFSCAALPAEVMGGVGLHEACDLGSLACDQGLVCLQVMVSGCSGGTGCCMAICDVEQPQCSMGTACSPLFGANSTCYADVGACVPG